MKAGFTKQAWVFAVLLPLALILVACGGAAPSQEAAATQEAAPTEDPYASAETEEPVMETANAVTVSDQTLGEGNTVTISKVVSDTDGWLVIHAQGDDGKPGPVLGYSPVRAGENTDVVVEVSAEGMTETLFAMLHVDAGTAGTYEFPGDDGPAKDSEGKVVVVPFKVLEAGAAVENAVTVENQPLGAGNSVTIASVTSATDGWLVIHAQGDDGKPGPVLGHSPVKAGENSDVVVEISTEGLTQTLFAMLHIDAGTAGTYEFPGDDGPAKDAAGNVVTPPFMLTNTVLVSDQSVGDGNTVTIDVVIAETAGWLVIHAQSDDGKPGMVLGYAPVQQGVNFNVVVEIAAEGMTETLFAMLHVDAGVAGTYEFPGDDGPAKDLAGNVVTPPFKIVQ